MRIIHYLVISVIIFFFTTNLVIAQELDPDELGYADDKFDDVQIPVYTDGKPSISIITERMRYVPGQNVVMTGIVIDQNGFLADARVELIIKIDSENEKIVSKQSLISYYDTGLYYDGLNIDDIGTYTVTATTTVNGYEESAFTHFEVINFSHTTAAQVSYVGLGALVALIIIVLMRITSTPTVREIFRFVCITIIAVAPVSMFILTDVEIGQNAPVGLVLVPIFDEMTGQILTTEWMINFGGTWVDDYTSGIQVPIFVLIFGIAGGYIRYLHNTYKLIKKDSLLVKIPKENNAEEIYEVRIAVLHQSMKDLALLFLAPLLAIASYFILFQAGITAQDFPTLAAISFGVGLVTDNVIARLEQLAGQALGKPSEDAVVEK